MAAEVFFKVLMMLVEMTLNRCHCGDVVTESREEWDESESIAM